MIFYNNRKENSENEHSEQLEAWATVTVYIEYYKREIYRGPLQKKREPELARKTETLTLWEHIR